MITWLQFAIALLKTLNGVIGWFRERQLIDQGRDEEIARVAASLLQKTEAMKKYKEEIDGLDEQQVDDLLKSLEPSGDVRGQASGH